MTLTITIQCDNAAFSENPGGEVARILRRYADDIDGMEPEETKLRDINGNTVGKVEVIGG